MQRRVLEYARARFRIVNIPNGDRSLVWRLTRQRYYGVPIIRDGKAVVFETDDHSQVIAKYLDAKLQLGLFPRELEGVQSLLWRYFENDVEGFGFKLNDIYWRELVPKSDELRFLRHKERKFGRGCLDHRLGIGQTNVFGCQDAKAAGDENWIRSAFDHAREPVKRRVYI